MSKSNGNVAFVTGGSRGIGLGIARALAAEGWRLAINGMRREEEVTAVLEDLRQSSPQVIYCRGDISVAEDRAACLDHIDGQLGGLHLLVNNAGIAPPKRDDILEATEESFDKVMDVNLKGPYFLTQAVA